MHIRVNIPLQLLFFVLLSGLLSSCSNDKRQQIAQTDSISVKNEKCIRFPDAKTFLPSWSTSNTLVYHVVAEPAQLHPTNGIISAACNEIFQYTQLYLMNVDYRNLKLHPYAIEAMPKVSEDGIRYTYTLRNDITFDDGSPLTAEDVVFTFKANKCPLTNNPGAKAFLDNLVDIVVDKLHPLVFTTIMKDNYIFNIDCLGDYPLLQRSFFDKNNVLATYSFAQFDDKNFNADKEKQLNAWATEFNGVKFGRELSSLVGAGPYKVEKWDAGEAITLVRKPTYWAARATGVSRHAFPERIVFKLNKDENSQLLEFKSQTFDASSTLSTKTLLELQKDSNFNANYNSCFVNTYKSWFVAMNTKPDGVRNKKIFTDKRVRKAMALLTPVDLINNVINKGRNMRMAGPVSPLKPECNSELKLLPFDIENAKILLDEAGWKDTDGDNIRDKVVDGVKIKMEFSLNYMTSTVDWKNIALLMAEQMYKAGVKANLNPLEFSVQFAAARNHDFDMLLLAKTGTYTIEDYTQSWHTASWSSKSFNFSGFGNAATDALIDSIKYTKDDEKRIHLSKKLQAIIYDEQPVIFLFAAVRRIVMHKRFGNQEAYFETPGIILSNLKLLSKSNDTKK